MPGAGCSCLELTCAVHSNQKVTLPWLIFPDFGRCSLLEFQRQPKTTTTTTTSTSTICSLDACQSVHAHLAWLPRAGYQANCTLRLINP